MKKRNYLFAVLTIAFMSIESIFAQSYFLENMPIDPMIRYGTLQNGMTYYIRHNDLPSERADFYFVQNTGSVQEEEYQRGLAHFLEHIAFNGTTHFPHEKLGIKEYTEYIGMRSGENLNAYTGFDETVYMLTNVPVIRKGIVDSCILILHDWSACLTLTDSMIEKERGIIREEWRMRTDAQMRLWEQQLPVMYRGSRYAERLPIGTIDVINNFKPEELREYYRKWYRPDLQAVIIVGDIDAEEVEQTLQSTFADIPKPVNPVAREPILVPDNNEPIVSIATDSESAQTTLSIYYKYNRIGEEIRGYVLDYMIDYLNMIVSSVMHERFSDILMKANPPFIQAYAGNGKYMISRTKEAWTTAATVKPGCIDEALEALVTETVRAKKFGFTESEFKRARTNVLKWMESAYNERDNRRNSEYANKYVRHFTHGEYIPGIEIEYGLTKLIDSVFTIKDVNEYIALCIGDSNIVISLTGPDNGTYPSEETLLTAFREKQSLPVEKYADEEYSSALINHALPAPGEIINIKHDTLFDATVYTLNNGVKVVLKETDHRKDQIVMKSTSPGGSTQFDDTDASNLKLFNSAVDIGGLGNFTSAQLVKALTGKNVSCGIRLTGNAESIVGETVPSDIRALFELVYLFFTAPRVDNEAYASLTERLRGQLENVQFDPSVAFGDSVTRALYGDNLRAGRIRTEDVETASYRRIMEMYGERFADASDFTFIFAGNIDKDSMIPMMKQYLATLPSLQRTERGDASRLPATRKGKYVNRFARAMETPKATVLTLYSGRTDYSVENLVLASMLKQILDLVYNEKVREHESGSYHVATSVAVSDFPQGDAFLQIVFDTDPASEDRLADIVRDELAAIVRDGPREADFIKTRDHMLKQRDEALQDNSFWLGVIDEYCFYGIDELTPYKDILRAITPEHVRRFAAQIVGQGNCIEVVMTPQ
ncbi:MAG: insulinase family protein [Tannerella sp.]|jgi:zinc protease|nr:insulinase family protein [Tannerella sp.]